MSPPSVISCEDASTDALAGLRLRIETLLEEVNLFKVACADLDKEVYSSRLEKEVRSEFDSLQRATEGGRTPSLTGWNISKFEAVWSHAKRCKGILALRKSFQSNGRPLPAGKLPALVDIVASDGLEWIKVETTTEKRLLFDLAKQGWLYPEGDSGSDASSIDGDVGSSSIDGRQGDEVGLVARVKNMVAVSKEHRFKCCHPQVTIILTRIQEGRVAEIDSVIAEMKEAGARVRCQSDTDGNSTDVASSGLRSNTRETVNAMLQPCIPTGTFNLDCTILIALMSDISHYEPPNVTHKLADTMSKGRRESLLRQLKAEKEQALIPEKLYPVLSGRDLVCTGEAAKVAREIAEKVGTSTEIARMRLLLGSSESTAQGSDETKLHFQKLSIHHLPADLKLPVRVEPFNADEYLSSAPQRPSAKLTRDAFIASIARRTSEFRQLSDLNKSVFTFGWKADITTITRSAMVANAIEHTICELYDEVERSDGVYAAGLVVPPNIFVLEFERELLCRPRERGAQPGQRNADSRHLDRKEKRRLLRTGGRTAVGPDDGGRRDESGSQ